MTQPGMFDGVCQSTQTIADGRDLDRRADLADCPGLPRPCGSRDSSVSMRRLAVVWIMALVTACLVMAGDAVAHAGHQHPIASAPAAATAPFHVLQSPAEASLPTLTSALDAGVGFGDVVVAGFPVAFDGPHRPCLGGCCSQVTCASCLHAVLGGSAGEPTWQTTAALLNAAEPSIGEGLRPPTDSEPPRYVD